MNHSQSLRVITLGCSDVSNLLTFYHPPSKQFFSSATYCLVSNLAAGPLFNLPYDGDIFFNTYHNNTDTHRSQIYQLNSTVYIKLTTSSNS